MFHNGDRSSGSKISYRLCFRLGEHVLIDGMMFGEALLYGNVKELPDET